MGEVEAEAFTYGRGDWLRGPTGLYWEVSALLWNVEGSYAGGDADPDERREYALAELPECDHQDRQSEHELEEFYEPVEREDVPDDFGVGCDPETDRRDGRGGRNA